MSLLHFLILTFRFYTLRISCFRFLLVSSFLGIPLSFLHIFVLWMFLLLIVHRRLRWSSVIVRCFPSSNAEKPVGEEFWTLPLLKTDCLPRNLQISNIPFSELVIVKCRKFARYNNGLKISMLLTVGVNSLANTVTMQIGQVLLPRFAVYLYAKKNTDWSVFTSPCFEIELWLQRLWTLWGTISWCKKSFKKSFIVI